MANNNKRNNKRKHNTKRFKTYAQQLGYVSQQKQKIANAKMSIIVCRDELQHLLWQKKYPLMREMYRNL